MRSENKRRNKKTAPPADRAIADHIQHLHERLAALSLKAREPEQTLLWETVEALRVQNKQLAELNLTLHAERLRYQDLFDAVPDAHLVTDHLGVIREANRAASGMLGLTPRFLVGKPIASFIAEDQRRIVHECLLDLPHSHEPKDEWELTLHPRRRPALAAAVTVAAVRDSRRPDVSLRWILRDITSRRDAETERLRLMADAIPQIAWMTGPDGSVDYYNARWYEYSGLTFAQTRDWGWEAVIHPDDLTHAGGVWRAAIGAGTTSQVEYRLRRKDGVYRWHLGRSEPVRDGNGRIICWVGTATDITERKEKEQTQAALLAHDHAVATQLQAALQPNIPSTAPGLALTTHYQWALPATGVGGDFLDCFAVPGGCTVLVVGDVSGKGLSAAVQVATVRNMLRFAIYNGRTVSGPVTSLNRTLAEYGLLAGFCTLFVGNFDPRARTLTYVNAGQEPGLIRRADTGLVEELLSTGPILGTFKAATYAERTVALRPGDALALFTDGITEAGPTRAEMLGLEGVATLLGGELVSGGDAAQIAETLARRLMEGVNCFAPNGIRDDVVLLLAVVESFSRFGVLRHL